MIDIGFTKLALIGVVALVVVGPEKLPKVARMAGTLFGRAQRYLNQVKSEVSREIELDELRKMQKEVHEAAADVERGISEHLSETDQTIRPSLNGDAIMRPLSTPTTDRLALKAKNFRKKKLARTSALPSWYKSQSGRRTRVLSAAARVARYRPVAGMRKAPVFFQ